MHLNNSSGPPSSTLARLLTAPERSFQSTPRQAGMSSSMKQSSKMHNNGEITITPIAGTSKKQDYSMVVIKLNFVKMQFLISNKL